MGSVIEATRRPLADALSTWRSLDPPDALPHLARVLDAETGLTEYEAVIDVELLAVDATSYRAIRERSEADPERMAAAISDIVAARGKLQNPWTGSGGVLMGRVAEVGASYHASDLGRGERVMPLASLVAIPLRLESVGPLYPDDPHVPASGRAIVTGSMACARLPHDLASRAAVSAFDVFPAPSHVRELATPGMHVVIFGAGHAGLLALVAAREAVGKDGLVTVIDRAPAALRRAEALDPGVAVVAADVTDTVSTADALAARGLPPGDLTLLCTTVAGAEGTAIVATAERGTIVFFSTATSFAAAALGADAVGSRARLLIPNGLTDDHGEYAFELLRRHSALRKMFEAAP
jgi:L-erythro-3,5-diaminohexanoate dehydrogenase